MGGARAARVSRLLEDGGDHTRVGDVAPGILSHATFVHIPVQHTRARAMLRRGQESHGHRRQREDMLVAALHPSRGHGPHGLVEIDFVPRRPCRLAGPTAGQQDHPQRARRRTPVRVVAEPADLVVRRTLKVLMPRDDTRSSRPGVCVSRTRARSSADEEACTVRMKPSVSFSEAIGTSASQWHPGRVAALRWRPGFHQGAIQTEIVPELAEPYWKLTCCISRVNIGRGERI